MPIAKRKRPRAKIKAAAADLTGRSHSFRALKAFGLWADRQDVKDAVLFTKRLRTQMEHGNDTH